MRRESLGGRGGQKKGGKLTSENILRKLKLMTSKNSIALLRRNYLSRRDI